MMRNAFAQTSNNIHEHEAYKSKPLFIYYSLTAHREQVSSAFLGLLPYPPKADRRVPLLILPPSLQVISNIKMVRQHPVNYC